LRWASSYFWWLASPLRWSGRWRARGSASATFSNSPSGSWDSSWSRLGPKSGVCQKRWGSLNPAATLLSTKPRPWWHTRRAPNPHCRPARPECAQAFRRTRHTAGLAGRGRLGSRSECSPGVSHNLRQELVDRLETILPKGTKIRVTSCTSASFLQPRTRTKRHYT